jgi:hypothetical protein
MKLRFYLDIWNGSSYQLQHGFTAYTHPVDKASSQRRIAFDVTIPDSMLMNVDAVASEVSEPVIVSEREE